MDGTERLGHDRIVYSLFHHLAEEFNSHSRYSWVTVKVGVNHKSITQLILAHDIAEKLLMLALDINQSINQSIN